MYFFKKKSDFEIDTDVLSDLNALGIKISSRTENETNTYYAVEGRSNPRIWFFPCESRHDTLTGLKLFQPTSISAKAAKLLIRRLTLIGADKIWAQKKFHLTQPNSFQSYFPNENLKYTIFTGTSGPHRKCVIQIQNEEGRVLGYCKFSTNKEVKQILKNEALILRTLSELNIESGTIPSVIRYEKDFNLASFLLIDSNQETLSTTSKFTKYHLLFLKEIFQNTRTGENNPQKYISHLASTLENFSSTYNHKFIPLLKQGIEIILQNQDLLPLDTCLSHGDFTPWNSPLENNSSVYVYDWEYAYKNRITGYDWVHYHTQTNIFLKNRCGKDIINLIWKKKKEFYLLIGIKNSRISIQYLILVYLIDAILNRLFRSFTSEDFSYDKGVESKIHQQMLLYLIKE